MYQCKFGQNPLFGSEYNARKQKVDRRQRRRIRDPHQKQYIPHLPGWGDISISCHR